MKKVTIRDIAADMGLSPDTVAKALNGGPVSKRIRRAVVHRAWQMGYDQIASNVARNVACNVAGKFAGDAKTDSKETDTGTILVLFNYSQSDFWTRMLAGISSAVDDGGYRMLLHMVDERDRDGSGAAGMVTGDVKGIIFLSVFPISFVREIAQKRRIMTFFNSPVNAQEYIKLGDIIEVEGFYSTDSLAGHVIGVLGCRRLAYVGFAEGSRMIQARYRGFLNACGRNGIVPDESLQYTRPGNVIGFDYRTVEKVIRDIPYIPDAFICEDDDVARNVSLALGQRDPQAVKKVVVTGFNNTLEQDFFKKDILTVDVRAQEVGRRLAKSVLDRVRCPAMGNAFVTIAAYPMILDE